MRRAIPSELRQRAAQFVMEEVKKILPSYSAVLSFASFQDEIDLMPLNQYLARERRLLLPRRSSRDLTCHWVTQYSSLQGERLKEPPISFPIDLSKDTLVLVPGLAFSRDHMRLGYGMGYYDRFLSRHPHLRTIGVGFCIQWTEFLPADPWDRSVDQLLLA
jgi:5-formyltetrahydrofolate cyclo-ligase